MAEPRQEGLDLRQWMRLVWRRKWLLLAIVVLVPVGVYVLSSLLPKTYEAQTTINVQATAVSSTLFAGDVSASSDIGEVQTLIETPVVGRRAANLLRRSPAEGRELLDKISVERTNPEEGEASFLTITARASDPQTAANIANAFARAVGQTRTANAVRDIDRTIERLIEEGASEVGGEASRDALAEQLQQLRGLRAGQEGTTPVVEAAVPASEPASPRPLRNSAIALALALLAAGGLAPLLDRLDRKIREPDNLEELLEPPLLATVPDDAFPGHVPGAHVKEAFQTLRASLTYFNVDRPLSTLVVASAAQQDGKTTVAINLAIAYALDGRDVVLVDADLRRPQIAERLGKEATVGLESVLVGERALQEVLIDVDVGGGRLRILPGVSPPPNPAVLLGSQRMRSLLADLTEQAEIVLIDTPAVLAVSDAIPLVNAAAGTVLVAKLDSTTKDAAQRTYEVITKAGGTVLGTIATGARAGGIYGYYGYGYYGYKDSRDGDRASAPGNGSGRRLRDAVRSGKRSR